MDESSFGALTCESVGLKGLKEDQDASTRLLQPM
jgi:hypothetical protein